MTTDPFTTAALDSAANKYVSDWDAFQQEPVDDWGFAEAERRAFVVGAEWARTHLAAQETDAERAVRELHRERDWRPLDGTFIGGTVCNACRRPYPCPTISVLDEPARAARRDEESLGDAQAHHFPAPLDYLNDARRDEEKR